MNWNRPGIPHKGWNCIDIEDVAENTPYGEDIKYEQCEMCHNEKVRYVHVMFHPDYPHTLRVGCDCAGKMEENYQGAKRQEADFKNKQSRHRNFCKNEWRYNPQKGTYSIHYKGEYLTLIPSKYNDNWGIAFQEEIYWKYGGKPIRTLAIAQEVAFEIFDSNHITKSEWERNS